VTHPRLSFVVPVRDDAVRLERCLRSIARASESVPIEVIVADNGSTDRSAEVAREAGAAVISLPDRPVSVMRNEAALGARAELIAFVDADHEVAPHWTTAVLDAIDRPAVWAVGANYHAPSDGTWVQRIYDAFRDHAPGTRTADWLPSGNLVVRKTAFEAVQGFDTTLESCEDVDLCRRLRAAGGTLVESEAIRSIHHGDPRTLRGLFLAELWRGRDNLRVSLRERLTLRSAPSVAIPIAHLAAAGLTAAGLIRAVLTGNSSWVIAGLTIAAGLTTFRATRLFVRLGGRLRDVPRVWLVAAVYDAARALALVARVGHDVRRRG